MLIRTRTARHPRRCDDCLAPAERGAAVDACLAHLRTRVDALTAGAA